MNAVRSHSSQPRKGVRIDLPVTPDHELIHATGVLITRILFVEQQRRVDDGRVTDEGLRRANRQWRLPSGLRCGPGPATASHERERHEPASPTGLRDARSGDTLTPATPTGLRDPQVCTIHKAARCPSLGFRRSAPERAERGRPAPVRPSADVQRPKSHRCPADLARSTPPAVEPVTAEPAATEPAAAEPSVIAPRVIGPRAAPVRVAPA
jgi:hypothetical protein